MAWQVKKSNHGMVFSQFNDFDIDKVYKKINPKVLGGEFASNNQIVDENKRTADEQNYLQDDKPFRTLIAVYLLWLLFQVILFQEVKPLLGYTLPLLLIL